MAGKRIAVISPDGQFGTVDEADAEAVTKAGGRVLSSREVAEREVQQRYDALPTAQKILGGVNTAAGALTGNPLLVGTDPNAPPTIAAYGAGVRQGLTGGLHDGATRQMAEAVGGKTAGEQTAARIEQEREASPIAHGAGELTGMVGGAVLGESAALRALPSAGIASAGAAVEAGTARVLGGLAARGALGRAAASGLSLGARGAVEGALYGAGQAAGDALLHDQDLASEKLFASMGHGALWGGGGGAALGVAGSLASSALRGAGGVLSRAARRGAARAEEIAPAAPRGVEVPSIDADAGLREAVSAESPIQLGRELRPVQLRPDVGQRGAVATENAISYAKNKPLSIEDLFTAAGDRPPSVRINPDAGLGSVRRGPGGRLAAQGPVEATDALKLSSKRVAPRETMLNVGDELGAIEARSPIKIPSMPEAAPKIPGSKLANEFAFDALGATKLQSRKALEHVAGGAEAVGEYVNRIAIKSSGGVIEAGMKGRADQLLEAIRADKYGRIAEGMSAAIKGTPARVPLKEITGHLDDIHSAMLKDPTRVAGAGAFRSRVELELSALQNAGKVAADGTVDAADMFYTRSALERGAYEVSNASSKGGEAYREFLRKWDGTTVKALDDAAAKAGKSGLGDQIRHWKREWQLASAAEAAAEGGAERVLRNNVFGIREGIGAAVGLAMGSPVGALGAAVAGKVLRERGAAAAAYAIGRAAESGSLARLVGQVDTQIAKASRGLLTAPAKRPLPELPKGTPRERAVTAMRRVAELQSDPERFAESVERETAPIAASHPEIARAITSRRVQAVTFLASKMPVQPDRDPLDPHPAPRMSDAQASEFARYAWYAERPARFFEELEHGKITPEGVEVARALMPRAFEELQMRTMDALATQMARGKAPPYEQRLRIGNLLGIEAVPAQRPKHMLFLQENVQPQTDDATLAGASGTGPSKHQPVKLPIQQSRYDRLEES